MIDQRGQLLRAVLGFAGLSRPSADRALSALRTWLDSWAGIGRIAVGMARQGRASPSSVLASRGPGDSLSRRAVPSAPHAHASPVHEPLRATRGRSALPSAVAHHDDIPAIRPGGLGNSAPEPEESGPGRASVGHPPMVRSKSSLRTSRRFEMPSTDGHRRIRSRECLTHSRRAGPESPRTAEVPVTESRYRSVLVHGHAQGRVSLESPRRHQSRC